MAVPATDWVGLDHPEITPPSNFHQTRDRTYISKDRHNAHLRRKAYTAIAAKMARNVHAVVNHGAPYRPFFEGVSPSGRTSLCSSRGGSSLTS